MYIRLRPIHGFMRRSNELAAHPRESVASVGCSDELCGLVGGDRNARRSFSAACSGNFERRTYDLHPVGGKQLIRFLRRG